MSQAQRLAALEAQKAEEWLTQKAGETGIPLDEAREQLWIWQQQLARQALSDDELLQLPEAAARAFLVEFSLAVAPDEDTEPYVSETLAYWAELAQQSLDGLA